MPVHNSFVASMEPSGLSNPKNEETEQGGGGNSAKAGASPLTFG